MPQNPDNSKKPNMEKQPESEWERMQRYMRSLFRTFAEPTAESPNTKDASATAPTPFK